MLPNTVTNRLAWGSSGSPNAGVVCYRPGATLGPRVQRDYELVLVHTGIAVVFVDGLQREILAGHAGLLLPGRTELFRFAADRETRHSWVALPGHLLDPATQQALNEAALCLPLSSAMIDCAGLARDVAAIDLACDSPALAAVARAALVLYLVEQRRTITARALEHPVIHRAREIAREQARHGLGAGDLAHAIGLSREHLARLFRRDLHMTPGAFLREERVRYAVQLLEQTGLPIGDVARQAGFISTQHFARLVRTSTGMSPTDVRARAWSARR
jgi:AraC family transcriptional regulator of arabinose operon